MKNIHLIPTDKPSRLTIRLKTNELMYSYKGFVNHKYEDISLNQNQHIYITSDEEIKEGDWVIENHTFKREPYIGKCFYPKNDGTVTDEVLKRDLLSVNYEGHYETLALKHNCKKIILTTDQDLIKDGVQAIGDEFIELFVKNLNCESIEVCKNPFYEESNYEHYKIIIPQEEPKQSNNFYEELKHYFETTPREKVLKDWNESVELDKIGPTVEEFLGMIQETLEEAAEKQWGKLAIINDRVAVIAFKAGAKWQAERMYSEEDMREAFIAGTQFEEDYDYNLYMEKWFEQFKKK